MTVAEAAEPATNPDGAHGLKITITGLGKLFQARNGQVEALRAVDLVIPDGEFCCIVGPSGCGKTTLLRILAGLEQHTHGRLEIAHNDRTKPLNCLVFQEQSIFPWMTVEENVTYGLRMRRVDRAERRSVVDYYVNKVGLSSLQAGIS